MKANRKVTKDEEAVSPVIGVILMVAITVILAAVIAAFVFGMGGSLKKQYVVACTVTQNGSNVDVTYQGGADASSLLELNVTIGGTLHQGSGVFGSATGTTALDPGAFKTFTGATSGRDHVIIVGRFSDGTKQVIIDTYV